METFGNPKGNARSNYGWSSGPLATTLRSLLRAVKLHPTEQRLGLAGLLFVAGERHVTARQLHGEAKALDLPLSLAAVKNTLAQFVAVGLIREIAVSDSAVWYDTNTSSRCHYLDEDRNVVSDIPYDIGKDLKILIPKGRKIVGVDIIVRLRVDDETED
jgi:Fur family transcriptional regulator, iron response regulator